MSLVVDRLGVPIQVGHKVRVFQDEETTTGVVAEVMSDSPTVNEVGHWVDINRGEGLEGMMSYVLEVLPDLQESA